MIVHSTSNIAANLCEVRVEGLETSTTYTAVRWFAQGAAAKHNIGYDTGHAAIVAYTDEHGRRIPVGQDTTDALGVIVTVVVTEP
jgi:outer membrane usher protein FimD/PapC